MRNKEFLKRIKQAVLTFDDKAEVILFGSRARGDAKKDSDWDILILTKKKNVIPLEKDIQNKVYDIELEYLQCISTIVLDKPHWNKMSITGFYENVMKEGITL
jgi:predicted nucleotidyltransferase